jgi:hypothetical protein
MPTIRCENDKIKGHKVEKCGRFLGSVSMCMMAALKENPEARLILRCPSCPPDIRWIAIYYQNGYVWRSLPKKEYESIEMEYDRIYPINQIA